MLKKAKCSQQQFRVAFWLGEEMVLSYKLIEVGAMLTSHYRMAR